MIYRARPTENIWLLGHGGKHFRLLAVTDSDDEANAFTQEHGQAGVFACMGKLVLIADNRKGVNGETDDAPYKEAAEAEGWEGPMLDQFGVQYFQEAEHGSEGKTWAAPSWRELCKAFDIEPAE